MELYKPLNVLLPSNKMSEDIASYDPYKTLSKVLWSCVEVLAVGLVIYFTNDPRFVTLIPILVGIRNYAQHKLINTNFTIASWLKQTFSNSPGIPVKSTTPEVVFPGNITVQPQQSINSVVKS